MNAPLPNLVGVGTRCVMTALAAKVGPVAGLAIGLASSVAGAVYKQEIFGDSLKDLASEVTGGFTTDFLKSLWHKVRSDPSRNYDVERALARAIRDALEEARDPRFAEWFDAWKLRLSRDSDADLQALFADPSRESTAVVLAENPAAWWPHAQLALIRWAREQRESFLSLGLDDDPAMPKPLRELLETELPARVAHALTQQLKADSRALTGFEQQFRTHLSKLLAERHAELAAAIAEVGKQQAETIAEVRELRREFSQYCGRLRSSAHITEGEAKLALEPWRTRVPDRPVMIERDLLDAAYRSIPLVNREADMAGYLAWLRSDRGLAVRVITGRAGAGKTRFAIDLMERLENEMPEWRAGFASERIPGAYARWDSSRPALIVFDYAASQARLVGKALAELYALRDEAKVRVLCWNGMGRWTGAGCRSCGTRPTPGAGSRMSWSSQRS